VLRAALALLVLQFAPAAVLGQSGCVLPDYVGEVDGRLVAGARCSDIERFTIGTPAGTRQVRIIQDERIPGSFTEPAVIARRGIERSAAALRSIGSGRIDNIVLLITGLQPRDDDDLPWRHGVTDAYYQDECLIVMYPANTGAAALDFSIAHEFFHCVQYATANDQMTAFLGRHPNQWWVEGTAEWFANLAIPNTSHSANHISVFDRESARSPVTTLAYADLVFFSWFAGQSTPRGIVTMMPSMPTSGGRPAEDRAAARLQGEEAWQAFVQAYLDREIRFPDGRSMPLNPAPGESYIWTGTRRQTLNAERLVVHRSQLVFTCGTWKIKIGTAKGTWAVSEAPGNWRALPAEFEVAPGAEKRWRLAAMGTGGDGFRLEIEARHSDPESKCRCTQRSDVSATGRDTCLVGKWRLASGGLNKWLSEQLKQVERASGTWDRYDAGTRSEDEGSVLSIRSDGRYLYANNQNQARVDAQRGDKRFQSRIQGTSSGTGLWGSADNTLEICAASEASRATATINLPNEDPWRVELPGFLTDHLYTGAYRYRCSDTELQLRSMGPGMGSEPMEWTYRRAR